MSLEIENLRIYYQTLRGDVKAVDNLSFKVENGEIMGLAGESGCGKSTLSNSLILLKPPMKYVSGNVTIDDEPLPIHDFKGMNKFRYKKVSIIPQYAMNALNPTQKIGKLISDLLENHGTSFSTMEKEIKERFKIVELKEAVLDMYPMELSGGMKQRVVMVISTLLNPSLLLADEITSALDVSTQKAVSRMIVEFRNRGFVKSVIFVTHDVSVLYQIADSIMIMYAGKQVERASTETIVKKPLHPYTKLLISSLPEVGIKYSENPLKGIPGNPPELLTPPNGCRFRSRCPLAYEKCMEEPPLVEVMPNHYVACWKVENAND
ncbi:ABC transporter ATP-binding protein [Kosmotoga pacifica]|uniref:Peptide ABC transporter ATPase n=1 Tax=Kosmotoga pacifica TaxID=1330330 RepID=A0A0G2Z4W1_9BACT|nr:ABC transporter ATP-binding protein [Kosmotoga pacifica]AKI96650.1 peptide ABC transporter ATPase [Kosmotoga pacifica]